jgi:hypothetical protein
MKGCLHPLDAFIIDQVAHGIRLLVMGPARPGGPIADVDPFLQEQIFVAATNFVALLTQVKETVPIGRKIDPPRTGFKPSDN